MSGNRAREGYPPGRGRLPHDDAHAPLALGGGLAGADDERVAPGAQAAHGVKAHADGVGGGAHARASERAPAADECDAHERSAPAATRQAMARPRCAQLTRTTFAACAGASDAAVWVAGGGAAAGATAAGTRLRRRRRAEGLPQYVGAPAAPTPVARNSGRSMFARCSGESSHASNTPRGAVAHRDVLAHIVDR